MLAIEIIAVPNIPDVQAGDDITDLLLSALATASMQLEENDIVVIAQKIVSKAEGRVVNLADVTPSIQAQEIAKKTEKDPRLVELILRESDGISRMRPGLLIVKHRLGFTSANAGIDRSNVGPPDNGQCVALLPEDPDQTAAIIRQDIQLRTGKTIAVLISDSHGRPFRLGTVGVAIGAAGLPALWDRRGEHDRYGYELQHTEVGTGDEIASAASLLMGQSAEGVPIVIVRGLSLPTAEGRARDLVRPEELDLYR